MVIAQGSVSSAPAGGTANPASAGQNTPSSSPSLVDRFKSAATAQAPAVTDSPDNVDGKKADVMGQQNPATGTDETSQVADSSKESVVGEKKLVEVNGRKFDVSKPEVLVKKLLDFESGMRKFQTERDQLKQQLQELQAKVPDSETDEGFKIFANAMKMFKVADNRGLTTAGVETVLKELFPTEVLNEWLQKKLQHHSHLMTLSPEQRAAYAQQFNEREEWEQEKIRVALEKEEIDQYKTERESLNTRTIKAELESLVTPGFRENAFKLANKKLEQALNQQLWTAAQAQIKEMIRTQQPLSGDSVSTIFATLKAELEDGMNLEADAKVRQNVENKKTQAMTGLSQAVSSGAQVKSISDTIASGASGEDTLAARFAQALRGRAR